MSFANGKGLLTIKVDRWDYITEISQILNNFIFRGHRNEKWGLTPTLERISLGCTADIKDIEKRIVTEFKRASHLYLSDLPRKDDWIEWFALIQHYGGPSRLIDFSHSIFVSAFFALEEQSDENAAIWAVNGYSILGKLKRLGYFSEEHFAYENNGMFFNDYYCKHIDSYCVGYSRPFRLNERLLAQQGTFLYSINMNNSFEDNLFNMLEVDATNNNVVELCGSRTLDKKQMREHPIIKIILDKSMRNESVLQLEKVNINYRTLFPGLEGYTKSLKSIPIKFSSVNTSK